MNVGRARQHVKYWGSGHNSEGGERERSGGEQLLGLLLFFLFFLLQSIFAIRNPKSRARTCIGPSEGNTLLMIYKVNLKGGMKEGRKEASFLGPFLQVAKERGDWREDKMKMSPRSSVSKFNIFKGPLCFKCTGTIGPDYLSQVG